MLSALRGSSSAFLHLLWSLRSSAVPYRTQRNLNWWQQQ
uniref:Uncharacterized protein n=1 Tax=Anguilla anguilla TaxID=7936 RepID=A0A0E9PQM0_ANGAN